MGLLKTENNQIVREYKTKGKGLVIEEAIMYKIDKNGNTIKIAVYDNDIKSWIRKQEINLYEYVGKV